MSEQLHVLHLAETLPPSEEITGGAPIAVRYHVWELAKHCRVTAFIPRPLFPPFGRYREAARRHRVPPGSDDRRAPAGVRILQPRYAHLPWLWPLTNPLQLVLWLMWFRLRGVADFDVVHAHRAYPMGFIATWFGRLTGVPVVITAHGSDVHTQAVRGSVGVRAPIRDALERAQRIIPVSRRLVTILRSLEVPEERIHFIPNGVDPDRFRVRDRAEARAKLGIDKEQKLFVCLAILVPVKGHADLLHAFRTVHETRPETRLALLGDGPLRSALEEQARRDGTQSAVRFVGHVAYDRVPDWIAAADSLVLPSLNEGTPLAALEALTSGRPVVGTKVGGIPEVVRDETLGRIVGPGDPDALAVAMQQVLDAEWDVEKLHARGMEYAWSHLMQDVLSIYRELI